MYDDENSNKYEDFQLLHYNSIPKLNYSKSKQTREKSLPSFRLKSFTWSKYSPSKNYFQDKWDSTFNNNEQRDYSDFNLYHPYATNKNPNLRNSLKCFHCGTTETPEWRRGPLGIRTLCNKCGLQYYKNKSADRTKALKIDFINNNEDVEIMEQLKY